MITDRNKFSFVTICIGLCFLLTSASVASAQASSNTQQESDQQQPQTQKQAVIATISVVDNKDKEEETNVIINEKANEVVHAFSPRLDYSNEWRPVGRGDPLKNDPTFDYSPPTLEHVRYWAETTKESSSKEEIGSSSSKQDSNSIHISYPNKQDMLLLAKPNEHLRGVGMTHQHQHHHPHPHPNQYPMPHQPYVMKNAKGETPLLQPKYTSVRRSYYAQQLPTRLMPPPMQSNSPPINTFNVPMKPSPASQVNIEYRNSMSGVAPPSMGSQSATTSHIKAHQYASMSTPSSMSWMYNSPSAMQHQQQQQQQHHRYVMSSSSGTPLVSKSTTQQTSRMPLPHAAYDSHPQDTHHYVSYMRPSVNSMTSHPPQESYSPNSLRHSVSNIKQSGGGRKPWLQELLKKEVVKTSAKPSYSASTNRYVYETTKPIYERMPSTNSLSGGFTPFTPVTFVSAPPTIATTTKTTTTRAPQTSFVPMSPPSTLQPTTSSTSGPPTASSTKHVIYTTPTTRTTTTTTAPRTTISTTTSRLLIPTTSNLAYRPTVASMQMTTDSLFSHYKQPEAPLRGPMYLIIEGHSKVKKYGKNGINLNLPKIVPVVPKREPVVRIAEPGEEKRGTPETFQVEHLHVKSSTTTTTERPSTTANSQTTRTTTKPNTSATTANPSTTAKPVMNTKLHALTNITKTTLKPAVSTTTTTTARPAATTASAKTNSTTAATKHTPENIIKSTAEIAKPLTTTAKPTYNELALPGMQGLLSLLDSSLGSFFAEQPLELAEMPAHLIQLQQTPASTTTHLTTPSSTILQAPNSTTPLHSVTPAQTVLVPVAANARIGTNANRILSADSDGSAEFSYTTDVPPREVRQVFDYDQRPESRLKDFAIKSVVDGVAAAATAADDEGASTFYEDEFEEYEDEIDGGDDNQQPIKRIDKLIYGDEGEFVGDYEDVKLDELGLDLGDVRMQAKMA